MDLGTLVDVYPVVVEIMGLNFDFDLALAIDDFVNAAKGRYEFHQRKHDGLLKKFGTESKDTPGLYQILPQNTKAYWAAKNKLDSTAVAITPPQIPVDALRGQRIRPAVLNALRRAGMLDLPYEESQPIVDEDEGQE